MNRPFKCSHKSPFLRHYRSDHVGALSLIVLVSIFASDKSQFFFLFLFISAYSTFYIVGLVLSMQIPFVGFQPIRTSEHMAAAGKTGLSVFCCSGRESDD